MTAWRALLEILVGMAWLVLATALLALWALLDMAP